MDTKVWNDFKNMQAIQRQRVNDFDDVRLTSQERELKEVEEAKQQQLRQKQEEDMRLAQQVFFPFTKLSRKTLSSLLLVFYLLWLSCGLLTRNSFCRSRFFLRLCNLPSISPRF